MNNLINETHDPELQSWVPSTLDDSWSFPIQNLPFGRFSCTENDQARIGVAIGDYVIDLQAVARKGIFSPRTSNAIAACTDGWLNELMACEPSIVSDLRSVLSNLLRGKTENNVVASSLIHRGKITSHLPVDVRNFSDFFTSIDHARNSGRLKRPDRPLLPNFNTLPVAYHGRASTISIDATPVRRPSGQFVLQGDVNPSFGPTRSLDMECELAAYVGVGNDLGSPIALADASHYMFGFSLLNDWSARDIQAWESNPLGPFLAKSFQSTVSPWVVTLEAFAPFRVAARRDPDAPPVLPYLFDQNNIDCGGLDIQFEILICSELMRKRGMLPYLLSTPRFRDQYWSVFQMLTHQTSNGCKVIPGDLLGSGTVSGPTREELGCFLEITAGGNIPVLLPTGEQRFYLQDGDELILTASCHRDGFASIGFGECRGTIVAAHDY